MTEARQKAEERLAKELGAEYEAETGGVYFTSGTSILVREILWKALVDREQELEKYRWIPVSERLPEASGTEVNVITKEESPSSVSDEVLIYFPYADCSVEWAFYDHEVKRWTMPGHGFAEPDCDPTHWMPLPVAPKEGQ